MTARFATAADGVPDVLVLSGTGDAPATATLRGARAHVDGAIDVDGETWTVSVPLAAARYGGPTLPLPTGDYRLDLRGADGTGTTIADVVPVRLLAGVRAGLEEGVVRVDPPVDAETMSSAGQKAAEATYAARTEPLENAVFFESFYGRNASCNPLALDREIARVAPAVTRYWSVVDLSVAVPAGAVPVVEGSHAWWRARSTARLLVVNDWLRRRFVRRSGQRVLQTWHGTPLKRLALHRPGFDPRRAVAIVRESRRWDVLLAQNPYAARMLRRAYAFIGRPLWVEGYPRNDVLLTGDPAPVRAALGIGADERVLLYAPTWRDDRQTMVDFLDLERLAARADAVVLVRGHSRTLAPGEDVSGTSATGPRVVDVTAYPDIARLLLVADALITDYSSVMFDFTVTGRPVYFFVPDVAHYRGDLRGFYFDLDERAPGPVVATQEELESALADEGTVGRFSERYAQWRARFNARDDGRAAERVVARILDQGFLDR
ncbi:CDP-glycerol glycerophosphotransferase family protein [Microbacterium telephonicum]|uniref:CDP-glycerol glycerophosphotransferase (TagB/SpsB family) n=1 Tax=Microbacterium telephonicum TaxID=1714841 RepID=A0A498BZD1_9MICO|nr:CDP-glycerol glycerophosphotransferase family protein [Microbacterium telephonicum]RLK49124.1 CDP-glycerol glycerophosphotransferase (TagB/SpsB family) [Microbacterium telephonicum]